MPLLTFHVLMYSILNLLLSADVALKAKESFLWRLIRGNCVGVYGFLLLILRSCLDSDQSL
jgi:hypothetical protein